MKELITRVEELAIQAAGAQLQIDKSEAEARDLGRELGKARQKIMELVNERDHALARVPPEAWLEENKKLADRIERMEASEDIVRKSLNEEITNRDRELREMDAEAKAHREALQAKDAEISKLLGAHADDIARIDKVTALLAVIESDATESGKEEGESVCDFLARQDAEIEKEGTRAFEAGESLKAVRQELGDRTQKVIELSRWHEENLEKIKGLEAQLAHETERLKAAIRSDEIYAKECGRFDGESLRSFIGRIVGDNIHMRDELSAANQRMQIEKMKELEELVAAVTADRDRIRTELAAILAEANKSGRCNGDPVQLLKQGQADLDALIRLETENANLLARMANLETQLKAANAAALSAEEDAERATFSENESAKLNALVSKLQGELATAKEKIALLEQQRDGAVQRVVTTEQAYAAQHQKADPEDMKAQLREAKQEYEIVRAQLDRIAKTAKRCGRTDKESVIDFMNRQQRERGAERSASSAACSRSVGQLERRLAEIQAVANRANRLACDPIALIIQGQRDYVTLTELLRSRPRTDALSNGHPVSGDSKEVFRLSECIAELQVELDEARGKYSDIVAALENETLQQLIKRTDRSAKEQNASLRAQLEKVQTILRQEMKDHQAAREAMTAAYKAAGVSGMRHDEELPAFINRLFAQISELRTAAHECGMLPDGNLRSFIYRTRRQLIDATEAGDRLQKLATETSAKLDTALATVANQSAAIAEAQRVTEKYTAACKAATKLKDWASTVRHKVLVKIVHDKAMQEYDNIIKDLDGKAAK